ncbi:diguanylate cyclase [Acaryochloris sp. IP29b_bin.137]|uniref:sensor domain-containing diguanylate cyclase n=1 Tax=Acaryochloris sp. IP29b_bin.137 TaxID=2969217 RepID=UPI002616F007|nr:diguanylate cyclase [Acaryochloris sp. IP29b_bin.137]
MKAFSQNSAESSSSTPTPAERSVPPRPILSQVDTLPTPSTASRFAQMLAPLTQQTFRHVIHQVKQELSIVHQTLSMLENQGFQGVLNDLLHSIAQKIGELLDADRTTIFMLDTERHELWSMVQDEGDSGAIEIRIPADRGIAGYVATHCETINIPYDFYHDPRSEEAKKQDRRTSYRTYTLLAIPILDQQGQLLAVVQMLNKIQPQVDPALPLSQRIHQYGFGPADETLFAEFVDVIGLLLESSKAFYAAAQKQRAAHALMTATHFLGQSGWSLEETLHCIMAEAKQLLQAEDSILWVVDRDRNRLWTDAETPHPQIPLGDGPLSKLVETGQPINLAFNHPPVSTHQFGGNTPLYSLLCLPVFNAHGTLIAITQLANKYRPSVLQAESKRGDVPERYRINFSQEDEAFLVAFNAQAGSILERAIVKADLEETVRERTQALHAQNRQLQQEIEERHQAEEKLKQLNQQLQQLSRRDGLTQIHNRRSFDETLDQEWRRLRREQQPLSVILCDVDHFKQYNDTYGHQAGDTCLQQVASTIETSVKRPADMVARYGGEEFVVLLPNTPLEGATHIAEIIRVAVESLSIPHQSSSVSHRVTLSLGVASLIPNLQNSATTLLESADAALYRAKHKGRNRVIH